MRRILFTVLSVVVLVATGVVGAIAVGGTGTVDPPPKIAFLANGIVPADALAAGGIAGQLGAPLFTTPASSLNDDARDGIVAHDPDLVIVLGGPIAISDAVIGQLSVATGLAITTAENPTDGIVRVAGGDRFATARAVAGLLAAYDPAYLPVDATALGAVDAATADMADDSDLLDGLDSTAFQPAGDYALADTTCPAGEVVTGIAADGTPVCAPDRDTDTVDGGDADTLDGLDSTDLVTADGEITFGSRDIHSGTESTFTIQRGAANTRVFGPNGFLALYPELPTVLFGRPLEIVGVEYCFSTIGTSTVSHLHTFVETFTHGGDAFGPNALTPSTAYSDDRCQRNDFPTPAGLTDDMVVTSFLSVSNAPDFANRVEVGRVTWFLRPATGPARATTTTDSTDSRTRAPD